MSLPYHKPPPFKRPNWERLNEGQRRYAMEQYNLALVRRGAKFQPPSLDNSEDNDFDIDDFVNNRANDLGLPDQGTTSNSQTTSQSLPNSQENEAADNFLNNVRRRQEMDVDSQQTATGSKRPADGGPPSKKSKSGSKPGTGRGTDSLGGGVDGGDASAAIEPVRKGITNHKLTFTFTKRWKFLTFGIADQIIDDVNGTAWNRLALTTSLASIPWEYAFFYMSPAEFIRMQDYRGVFAKHCNVSISQYNPRVAFQTGDSTSQTATLNQNKFTRWGIGLRSNAGLYCSDRDYLYDTTEPMKPTGFDTVGAVGTRSALMDAMYGLPNPTSITTHNLNIPAYATGQELELQQYLTIYAPKTGSFGFPPYDQYCQEGNSMDFLGQEILNQSYNFEYAPLQRKHLTVFDGNLGDGTELGNVACGTKIEALVTKKLPESQADTPRCLFQDDYRYTGVTQTTGVTVNNTNFENNRMYHRFPMEQNGSYLELNRKPIDYANQQSIHVGVRAVPKLSTNANLIQTNSWLDTQIYFTVQASLTVEATDSYFYIRGGPTILPSQIMLASCEKSTDDPPVFTPQLQPNDRVFVAGRRNLIKNTSLD